MALLTLPSFAGRATVTGHSRALFLLTCCFFSPFAQTSYQHIYVFVIFVSPLNNSNIVLCECWYQKTSKFITLEKKMQIQINKNTAAILLSSSLNVFVFHGFRIFYIDIQHRLFLIAWKNLRGNFDQIRWRTWRSAATLPLVVMATFCCSSSAAGLPGRSAGCPQVWGITAR